MWAQTAAAQTGSEVTWVATFTITQQPGSSLTQGDETAQIWHSSPWPLAPCQAYTWPKPAPVFCAMERGKPQHPFPAASFVQEQRMPNTHMRVQHYYTHHFSALAARELYLLTLISPLTFDVLLCSYHHLPSLWKQQIHEALQISREKKPELQSSGRF